MGNTEDYKFHKLKFAKAVSDNLKDNDIRKTISLPGKTFYVSDDAGNSKSFVVKGKDKSYMYTAEDVKVIIEACVDVVQEVLKNGGSISIPGLGKIYLNYRKETRIRNVSTGEVVTVKPQHSPKFNPSTDLKDCARVYDAIFEAANNTETQTEEE